MFPLSADLTAVRAKAARQAAGPHNYQREAIMKRIYACLSLLVLVLTGTMSAAGQSSSQPAITSKNAAQVREIAHFGKGTFDSVVWSPDGKTIAVGGSAGAWLYETENFDAEPRLLEGHTDPVTSVAFSSMDRCWRPVVM